MEIMFDDLTYEAQNRLLKIAGVTSPEETDWDHNPVAIVELESKENDLDDEYEEGKLFDDDYDFDDDDSLY